MVAGRKQAKTGGPEIVQGVERDEVERVLRNLVKSGFASWAGGKPKGSDPPIEITPGPPVSDYVIEDRG